MADGCKNNSSGAWFPLGLAVLLVIMFAFWSWAKSLEDGFDASHRHRLHEFLTTREPPAEGKQELHVVPNDFEGIEDNVGMPSIRQRTISTPVRSTLQLIKGSTDLVRLPVFALFHNSSASTLNGRILLLIL